MKKVGKFAAVLVVMAAVIGMMGCAQGAGGDNPVVPPAKQTVATPTFSVAAGAVDSGTTVTISCATTGATIYYTTDGDTPTASSATYSTPISITTAQTLKAIAVKDGMNDSAIASASYTKYAVGDFILKDGKRKSKDETPAPGTVAAVIVRADTSTKPALGVGIVHNKTGLKWCEQYTDDTNQTEVVGLKTNITALQGKTTSGYMDGSDSWEKLKAACSDAEEHPEYYPAFNYSLTYATTNGLTGTLATGWYLPTVAELITIYDNNKNNEGVIEASLTAAGGNTFGANWYWSCCQYSSVNSYARDLNFSVGYMGYADKKDVYYVCSVRAFN